MEQDDSLLNSFELELHFTNSCVLRSYYRKREVSFTLVNFTLPFIDTNNVVASSSLVLSVHLRFT